NQRPAPGWPCNTTLTSPERQATRRFAAFCMWISKYAFSKIGYLDDNTFTASFEDDDYALRACLAGLPCEQFNILVHHELNDRETQISTTGSYDGNQLVDHMVKFMNKWSIPEGI